MYYKYLYDRVDSDYVDGKTGRKYQDAYVDSFNKPRSEKFFFLLSTSVGGFDISLVIVDIVVLFKCDRIHKWIYKLMVMIIGLDSR